MISFPSQIGNILSIERSKLESVCIALGIVPMDSDEYEFLQQYFKLISKVASALKILEGDKNTFASYLSVLIDLRRAFEKYTDFYSDMLEKCNALGYAIRKGLQERFSEMMNIDDAKSVPLYVAMMSNPKYKLNFMGVSTIAPNLLSKLKEILVEAGM